MFCLCFTTANITTQQSGSTWRNLGKPAGFGFISMWGFLACSVHLCEPLPQCFSCSSPAGQGWVSLTGALLLRAHPGREAGRHQHSSDGGCYLCLLWPFGSGISSVLRLGWILHSHLVNARRCLHLVHPQPFSVDTHI